MSQKYGISGFFLLSSFLLTYRLIKDFYKPNSNIILCVLQYFIRRFFRIYVVVVLFTIAAVHGPHFFEGFQIGAFLGVKPILLLQYPGHTVLWTICPEIRYYFVIPFICLIFYSMKCLKPLLFIAGVTWTAYDQSYNFFGISWDDGVTCGHNKNYALKYHFFVFFIGTLFAMAYFLVEQYELFMAWIKNFKVQIVIIMLSLAVASYSVYYHSGYFFSGNDFR